jgi:hypothetical protein
MATSVGCSEDTIDEKGFGTISGTVVEEGTNEPVENARISTNPASSTVFTDESGKFTLSNIPADDYSVEARKEGLLAKFEGASVMANATVSVVFEMQQETAGNKQPSAPVAVSPQDNARDINVPVKFSWTSIDPDDDDLVYTLEIRNDKDEDVLRVEEIEDTTYTVEGLQYNTKYFWQVTASDDVNPDVLSSIYSFNTLDVSENRILFTRIVNGNSVIFARNSEGIELQLTSSANNSFRPRKNNATNKIAFLRTVGAQTHLFTMNTDGSQKRQVTSAIPVNGFNMEQVDFSWANDGASLLYPNFNKLYQIQVTGGGNNVIYETSNGDFITEVNVSENDQTIALITNNSLGYEADLFTINFEGEVQERILNNVQGALGGLELSVQGNKLLYTYDTSGFENNSYRRLDSDLFVYDFQSRQFINLSSKKEDGTNDLDARFSPNEAEVIFVNTSNDGISQQNIYTVLINPGETDEDYEARTLLIENAAMPDWE